MHETSSFVLRRKSSINTEFLLKKTQFILSLRLSNNQETLYKEHLQSSKIEGPNVLNSLCTLMKLSNHLNQKVTIQNYKSIISSSTKYMFVKSLLLEIAKLNEKMVIVSHWTLPLDIFEHYFESNKIKFVRIDGSTKSASRQQ
jgi:SNF2 family DNA or RNA helicase